jgi:hypothetical protein
MFSNPFITKETQIVRGKGNLAIPRSAWLLLAIGLGLLAPILGYQGVLLGGDDVLYARLAADMASGDPTFGINTHTFRLGFIAPIAVLYAAFGIHDWTTVAFPILCTLLAVFLAAYGANRLYGRTAAAWAALLCGLNPILFRNGLTAMPDIPAGFLYGLFVVSWSLLVANRVQRRRNWALIAGLACAWAMATRISIAPMVAVTLLGFLVLGWRRSAFREFPLFYFCLGGCLIGIPFLLSLWWYTGTPLYFLDAAQGGYNAEGAPWLRPLAGLRLWTRLSGLSIFKASVEGYLFAVFPIIVAMMTLRRDSGVVDSRDIYKHLLLAIISPLLILSHFSTSISHWYPVHLDLRFGSAIIIPTAVLVAGACENFAKFCFSQLTKLSTILALLLSVSFLAIGLLQHNLWTLMGAGASLIVSVLVMQTQRWPKYILPSLVVTILSLNWLYYISHDYKDVMAHNKRMRLEAEAVPWDPNIPVLTDPITAQYLPYINAFTAEPKVARWKGEGEISPPFQWSDVRDTPWPGKYLLVWFPRRAYFQTIRWEGKIPQWLLREAAQGKLIHQFQNETAESTHNVLDRLRTETNEHQTWPQAGIYLINGES